MILRRRQRGAGKLQQPPTRGAVNPFAALISQYDQDMISEKTFRLKEKAGRFERAMLI